MSKTTDKGKDNFSDDTDDGKSNQKKSTGRGRSRGRGRRTKSTPKKSSNQKKDVDLGEKTEEKNGKDSIKDPIIKEEKLDTLESLKVELKLDTEFDIESLPSFISTSSTAFNSDSQVWDNRVNLIGQKCQNITIHICDKCNEPIFIYGRLIPCKHAFCSSCSNKHEGNCFTCNERIINVERCTLGTLFICSTENCKRTYLSERDLHAHINHRHTKRSQTSLPSNSSTRLNYEHKNSNNQLNSSTQSFINKLVKPVGSYSNNYGSRNNSNNNTNPLYKSNRIQFSSSSRSHPYSIENFTSSSSTIVHKPYGP